MKVQFDKRIRLQIFSVSHSQYRQVELSWKKLLIYSIAAGLSLAVLITVGLMLFSPLFHEETVSSYANERAVLHDQVAALESRYRVMSSQIKRIEEDNGGMKVLANYADTAGMRPAQSLIVPDENVYLAYAGHTDNTDSLQIQTVIDNLEQRLDETLRTQEDLGQRFPEVQNELKHLPSIRPLFEGRISDLFGNRKDPFVHKTRHHNGIDISAPRGTEVYAPAAGEVELVRTRYSANRGYGRVVIINHGRGLKTLYGHLHKIFVKQGQTVDRWDVIGLVGDTGRATGPHLHYEVWENGKAIDPLEYILN